MLKSIRINTFIQFDSFCVKFESLSKQISTCTYTAASHQVVINIVGLPSGDLSCHPSLYAVNVPNTSCLFSFHLLTSTWLCTCRVSRSWRLDAPALVAGFTNRRQSWDHHHGRREGRQVLLKRCWNHTHAVWNPHTVPYRQIFNI